MPTTLIQAEKKPEFLDTLRAVLPIARWLPTYDKAWLRSDFVASITCTAYSIPVSLAYAALAGLPSEVGLYCSMLARFAYAPFGTSGQLSMGPMSSVSILIASTLGAIALTDPAQYMELAAFTALLIALICFVAYVLRLGQVVNFISATILTGLKAGVALQIASTQLPKLFGIPSGGDNFFNRLLYLGQHISETNLPSLGIGLGGIALLLIGEKLLPNKPTSFAVILLSIGVMSLTDLSDRGVQILGNIPAGIPALGIPSFVTDDIAQLLPLALACFLLSYVEGIASARTFAQKHDDIVDADQELLAMGLANMAAGLGHSYPAGGGFSQTAVNDSSGAKTPLSSLFSAILLGIILLFFTDFFANLPVPILPAVVLVAIKGFFDIPELMHFYRVSQLEFRVAIATFAGVVCLDVLEGVLVGVICSLLLLLRLAANPHTAVLGRIPGTRKFSDISRHPENETVPGIVIFRVDGGIFYFNAETVKQRILQLADSQEHPVQLLIFDLSSAYMVDIAGARMLKNLCLQLQTQGITLKLLRTRGSVRDTLRAEGLEESAGKMERGESISATVDEWREKLSVAMPTDVPADAPEESLPEELAPTPASIQV